MSNMSYCRFNNTLADLRDCYENMDVEGGDELSAAEEKCREKMIKLCRDIVDDFGYEIE